MWSSAMINPIIYCLSNEKYRNAYITLCRNFFGLPEKSVTSTSRVGRSMKHSSRPNQDRSPQPSRGGSSLPEQSVISTNLDSFRYNRDRSPQPSMGGSGLPEQSAISTN